MKVDYTPGNPDGTVGKTYKVEIVGLDYADANFISYPILKKIKIQMDDKKTLWVNPDQIYLNSRQRPNW